MTQRELTEMLQREATRPLTPTPEWLRDDRVACISAGASASASASASANARRMTLRPRKKPRAQEQCEGGDAEAGADARKVPRVVLRMAR